MILRYAHPSWECKMLLATRSVNTLHFKPPDNDLTRHWNHTQHQSTLCVCVCVCVCVWSHTWKCMPVASITRVASLEEAYSAANCWTICTAVCSQRWTKQDSCCRWGSRRLTCSWAVPSCKLSSPVTYCTYIHSTLDAPILQETGIMFRVTFYEKSSVAQLPYSSNKTLYRFITGTHSL
jgi:hypothetical protein